MFLKLRRVREHNSPSAHFDFVEALKRELRTVVILIVPLLEIYGAKHQSKNFS
jgi:hypothetical protein